MKKFYIKILILLVFLSLTGVEKAYCAIDIKEFKRLKEVKNLFHKVDESK